jgi:K+-transporting ATPase ATPase A chain
VFAAMTVIFLAAASRSRRSSRTAIPRFAALGIDQAQSATQSGGNMEGKETRFGIASSTLWAVATTAASCGSVNSMHDSFTPLAGGIPM